MSAAQRRQVNRLKDQVARLREVLDAILALADELKRGTIEQVLVKSDEELAIEVLVARSMLNGRAG